MTKQHQRFLYSRLALIIVPAPVGREVGRAVPDYNEDGSPFFLSYARARENSAEAGDVDQYVETFFRDLAGNVSVLINLPAGVPTGFMDREMAGGEWWTDALMRAVGSCHILVALLSPGYLSSKWCRMEWHAFEQRQVRRLDRDDTTDLQGCIIPVRWAPFPFGLPAHIGPRLIFSPTSLPHPKVPGQYREDGIFGLMRMGEPKNFYEIVTWQLAKHIANIYYRQRTKPRQFKLAELQSCLPGDGHGC